MTANLFPVFLKLAERPCVVVGACEIAAAKIAALLEAGAHVTVVAPQANSYVRELAAAGKLRWIEREFRANDLVGAFLVIAATSEIEVNHAVFVEAQRRGILTNAVDDPPHCDFYFPAVVRRGALQIAISTSGESPALAQRLRRELEASLNESLGDWVAALGKLRRKILATVPPSDARKRLLHSLASREAELWKSGAKR